MNLVVLHGELGERFGREFRMDVRDPAEAMRGLVCQLDGMRQMVRHGQYEVTRVLPNDEWADDEMTLYMGVDNSTIHIMPYVEGAAKHKGAVKLIAGVAMIGASFLLPGSTIALIGTSLRTVGVMAGAAIALGGLSQLIAPTPKVDTSSGDDSSFIFGSGLQSTGQNIPVPIHIGRVRAALIPVATQIVTNEYNTESTGGNAQTALASKMQIVRGGSYHVSEN